MTPKTLLDLFHRFAELDGDFLAYDDGIRYRRYSYGQVAAAAQALAGRLGAHQIGAGDKILLWGENRPEWLVAFWGCLLRGAIVVPVDFRASSEFVSRVYRIVNARLLITGGFETPAGTGLIWDFSSIEFPHTSTHITPHPPSPSDLAEIIFTSGATSEPKGVTITHRNVLANVIPVSQEIGKYRRYAKPFLPIRFLNLLPLSHMFGQSMATFIPPEIGGLVIFLKGFNPHDIVRLIRTRRVSVLVSVPKILEVLREHILRDVPEAAQRSPAGTHWLVRWWRYRRVHRLFGWKFWAFVVGAAPLDPDLEEFWSHLGFVVIQGYGLTETAPVVTVNHPFHTRKGAVGKPIAGVEIKLAADGEILVRGENVTHGYFNAAAATREAFEDGWFHTGDIGALDDQGQLYIRGRKKEMIVTPEGLNVFPEDVEKVLNSLPGVRESAIVGAATGSHERVHAALVLEPGADPEAVIRQANALLEGHQKIRGFSLWPHPELPRTEGTRKLKRREIHDWVALGGGAAPPPSHDDPLAAILSRYAGDRSIKPETTLEELGLSSLDRVELLMELEQHFDQAFDETRFTAQSKVRDLTPVADVPVQTEPVQFPSWNRSWPARLTRRISLPTWVLPLFRLFAWLSIEGRDHLKGLEPPVIFAANHQSHFDAPAIFSALPPKWRYRLAPAMSKEFFAAHFYPERHGRGKWFTNSLNYYLAALMFNAFPFPQREGGTRQTLRYAAELAGEGWCILIFPEGVRSQDGSIGQFRGGVGMMASRLGVPVVPIRLEGLDQILHSTWSLARPGSAKVKIGKPLLFGEGDTPQQIAQRLEEAVRRL